MQRSEHGAWAAFRVPIVVSQGCGPRSLMVTDFKNPGWPESVSQRLGPWGIFQSSLTTLTPAMHRVGTIVGTRSHRGETWADLYLSRSQRSEQWEGHGREPRKAAPVVVQGRGRKGVVGTKTIKEIDLTDLGQPVRKQGRIETKSLF